MNLMFNDDSNSLRISPDKSDAAIIEEKDSTSNLLAQESSHSDTKSSHSRKFALGGRDSSWSRSVPYVKWKDIKGLAIKKFAGNQQGITYLDILKLADNPSFEVKQAQKVLRNHKDKRNGRSKNRLYTSARTVPQQYFISQVDASAAAIEISANSKKSRHSDPTGVKARHRDKYATSLHAVTVPPNNNVMDGSSPSTDNDNSPMASTALLPASSPSSSSSSYDSNSQEMLAYQQSNSFYDRLLLFKGAPLSIHNIHLDFLVPVECYKLLDSPGVTIGRINKEKTLTRKIGKNRKVTYKLSPHGKVEVIIGCTDSPFPIHTDSNVTSLMGFMHQLQYNLSLQLSDAISFQYVPPPETWRLTQADISKDVRVDPISIHVEPKMQLDTVERTLRLYVKLIDGESVLRLEEMRAFSDRFFDAIASLREGVKKS